MRVSAYLGHLDTEDTLKLTRSEKDERWHYECRHWLGGVHRHPVFILEPRQVKQRLPLALKTKAFLIAYSTFGCGRASITV